MLVPQTLKWLSLFSKLLEGDPAATVQRSGLPSALLLLVRGLRQ